MKWRYLHFPARIVGTAMETTMSTSAKSRVKRVRRKRTRGGAITRPSSPHRSTTQRSFLVETRPRFCPSGVRVVGAETSLEVRGLEMSCDAMDFLSSGIREFSEPARNQPRSTPRGGSCPVTDRPSRLWSRSRTHAEEVARRSPGVNRARLLSKRWQSGCQRRGSCRREVQAHRRRDSSRSVASRRAS